MQKTLDLTQLTGKDILDFITHQMGEKLPERGFLAGQSVTSIVLYLMGKQNSLHINDYDVFDRYGRTSSRNLINVYDSALILKGDSFGINRIKSENISPDFIDKLRSRYIEDVKEGSFLSSDEIQVFNNLKNAGNTDFSASDPSATGYRISGRAHSIKLSGMGSLTEHKMKHLRAFLRANKVIGNRENKLAFFVQPASEAYRIQSSKREGMVNIVLINFSSRPGLGINRPLNESECLSVITHFDLNANQVGVNLETGQLLYTSHFQRFADSNQLKIVTLNRYWHSLIRYFSKRDEHGYFGNDECEIDKVMTYHSLRNSIGLDQSLNDDLVNPYVKEGPRHIKNNFNSPLIGKKYSDLFNSSKAKDLFNIEKVDYYHEKFKLDLYELTPKSIEKNSILNGDHKRSLEKAFGEKIYGYRNLALATVIPSVEGLHHQTSPRKVMKSYITFKESIKNKDLHFSGRININLCKLATLALKEMPLTRGHLSQADIKKVYAMVAKHPEAYGWFEGAPIKIWGDIYKRLNKFKKISITTYYHLLGSYHFIGTQKLLALSDEELRNEVIELMYKGPDLMRDPLVGNFYLDDIEVSEIVSYRRLVLEGDAMKHCVASYHEGIKNLNFMIFSLIDKKGIRSTAEVRLSYPLKETSLKNIDNISLDELSLRVMQHRARFNAPAPLHHTQALKEWVIKHNAKLKESEPAA